MLRAAASFDCPGHPRLSGPKPPRSSRRSMPSATPTSSIPTSCRSTPRPTLGPDRHLFHGRSGRAGRLDERQRFGHALRRGRPHQIRDHRRSRQDRLSVQPGRGEPGHDDPGPEPPDDKAAAATAPPRNWSRRSSSRATVAKASLVSSTRPACRRRPCPTVRRARRSGPTRRRARSWPTSTTPSSAPGRPPSRSSCTTRSCCRWPNMA